MLLHGYCHARATGGFEPEQRLLESMGAQVETPETDCCGMAGGWGLGGGHALHVAELVARSIARERQPLGAASFQPRPPG